MRFVVCVFVCLAAAAPSAVAQNLDKARLRQTIEMPAVAANLGVHFRASERDGRGNKFDSRDKIADLEKKLTGGPDDASVYLELHAIYLEVRRDEKTAREMATKAESVLREHVKTDDAKKGYLLPLYGNVLEVLVENPWGQCEQWGRRAVSIAPQDWHTWAYLAHTRHQQIPIILVGGDPKLLPKYGRTQEIIGALYNRALRAEHVDQAEKVLNEALGYHDKAKQLAPTDPKCQEQRYGFKLSEVILRNAICVYRNQKPQYPMVQLERTLLDELQAAARLQPDHLLWQSQMVHQLILAGYQYRKDNQGKTDKTFTPARPEDMQAIRDGMARIEKLATEGKGDAPVYCYSMLATLSASMQDHAGAEKYARKILQLDPKNQTAGEQLQQALLLQERKAEQLQAAQVLADANRSSRNCFLLAKALVLNQRYDLAEQMCLAGLKLDTSDPYCLLGLAALAMRKGDDQKTLDLARDLLNRARHELRPESGMHMFIELEYLEAIHQALSGDADLARLKLERLHRDNPEVPRFEKAISAIGR
jgi:hypothetical protein